MPSIDIWEFGSTETDTEKVPYSFRQKVLLIGGATVALTVAAFVTDHPSSKAPKVATATQIAEAVHVDGFKAVTAANVETVTDNQALLQFVQDPNCAVNVNYSDIAGNVEVTSYSIGVGAANDARFITFQNQAEYDQIDPNGDIPCADVLYQK